jgi:hypothetical protein
MKTFCSILTIAIIFVISDTEAISFDGFIGKFPVAFEFPQGINTDTVIGSYFYTRFKRNIKLFGKYDPGHCVQFDSIYFDYCTSFGLIERDTSNKVSGIFQCFYDGSDSIKGLWKKPSWPDSLRLNVKLCRTNDLIKKYPKIPRSMLPDDDKYDMPEEYSTGYMPTGVEHDIVYYANNILCICERNHSGDGSCMVQYLLYNLNTNNSINIKDEIDSIKMQYFERMLQDKVQTEFNRIRKSNPDSVWRQLLNNAQLPNVRCDSNDTNLINCFFKAPEVLEEAMFSIDNEGYIVYGFANCYCNAFDRNNQYCNNLSINIKLPKSEIEQFLRKNSILHKLGNNKNKTIN